MRAGSWWSEDDDGNDVESFDSAPSLTVYVSEPTVVGYLYGPHGEIIATFLDRPTVPIGFQSAKRGD